MGACLLNQTFTVRYQLVLVQIVLTYKADCNVGP